MNKQKNPAMEELREMLPSVLAYNGAVLLTILAAGFAFGHDWRLYTGLLVGNLLFAANILLIGVTAASIVRTREVKRGQFLGNFSYGARYIGIFLILALLLTFDLISLFTAAIPLFYPKIYYTVRAFRQKDDDFES